MKEFRTLTFGVRLSKAEWADIERAATLADTPMIEWVRRLLLRTARQQIAKRRRPKSQTGRG